MTDALLGPIEHLMTSGWIYAALVAICTLDALVPFIPSEAPVILAGVYAASDPRGPHAVLVVASAALGAALGDHASYAVGGTLLGRRLLGGGGRRRSAVQRVRKVLHTRGTWALLVVRFVPGGRSIATLSLGATRYPVLRRFTPYDLLATTVWAVHGTVVGYVGGRAFARNPLAGIITGMALAMIVAALIEVFQRRRASLADRL